MNIVLNNTDGLTAVDSIPNGECFFVRDSVYLKTDIMSTQGHLYTRCVRLDTGVSVDWPIGTLVYKVEGHFIGKVIKS